ncbi:MAG: purine-nucleoside phosphorylase [Chloroflexota bacterium]|nr:purine-nucleoside phosphorylase [Chloroflexota bacterium]
MDLYEQVVEATQSIRKRATVQPRVALILGSGLGDLANEIQDATTIPYAEIPYFAQSTVVGHAGRLLLGTLEQVPVVVMQGRFHAYEGYSLQTLTLPVRVLRMLGAETLIVTNAAGGINVAYRPGDLMLIRDHINMPGLAGKNPLIGPNDERFGERFPPLAHAYDAELQAVARMVATQVPGLTLHEGVYTMVGGPNYETSAELRFLGMIGTDAVGMSTVPEVLVARHMGMRVLGLSLITNAATGSETETIKHSEVLTTADNVRALFAIFVRGIVRTIGSEAG